MKKLSFIIIIVFTSMAVYSQVTPSTHPLVDTSIIIDTGLNIPRTDFNTMKLSEMVKLWQGLNGLNDSDLIIHFMLILTEKHKKYKKITKKDINNIKGGKWDDRDVDVFILKEYMKSKM